MMVRSSRVDQPPVSGVPVAGATRRGKRLVLRERKEGKKIHTSGIQGIDIDTQIHGFGSPDSVLDLLDDARHADGVNFPRFDDFETAVAVVVVVG